MMKNLFLVSLLIFIPVTKAYEFETVDCSQELSQSNMNHDTNKTYPKPDAKVSIIESGVDKFAKPFIEEHVRTINDPEYDYTKDASFTIRYLKRYEALDADIGTYRKTQINYSSYNSKHLVLMQYDITPKVTYRLETGILSGLDGGEFGGELVHIDNSGKLSLIAEINVIDIYRLSFGIVILGNTPNKYSSIDSVYLYNKNGSLIKMFNLIGDARESWLIENGDLLINSLRYGSQVLTKSGMLKYVKCSNDTD